MINIKMIMSKVMKALIARNGELKNYRMPVKAEKKVIMRSFCNLVEYR